MNALIKIIKTGILVISIGIAGLLFCRSPAGFFVEEEYGLDWLFKLRGPLPTPTDVVIVSIDQASTEILHLPDNPEKWPRAHYAELVGKINRQHPAMIAFNIHFGETREPGDDALLGQAIAEKRNVILSNYIKQHTIPAGPSTEEIRYESVIEPIPELSQAALGTAPFPLPRTFSTVKEFWTYKHSAGDIPTFPVSIFQCLVIKEAYPEVFEIIKHIDPALSSELPDTFAQLTEKFSTIQIIQEIQRVFTRDPTSLDQTGHYIAEADYSPRVKQLLQSWLMLLKSNEQSDDQLYLNYYGDVGTISTIPFYQALGADILNPTLFKDKIVLIGYSDNIEPEKNQGFYTAYSKTSGKVASPIEIAGTAIANLIDHSWIKPLPIINQLLLILVWGILLSGIFLFLSYKSSVILVLLATAAYVGYSEILFTQENIWIPLVIPLLQSSLVLLLYSAGHFLSIRKVSGRYLPPDVFDDNARNPGAMNQYGVLMHGVCLATDAGQYTTLSESISPLELHKLMNDYYAAIFPGVKSRNGLISDVIGDAMLAVWAAKKIDNKLRLNACCAALEIKSAVDEFNESSPHYLATRMGLHYGEMRLGNVGAKEHFEYRAVGDTVNTSTRIEGLNKLLGTGILVSAPVIDGLSEFITREVGTFLLKGKINPVTLFELMGLKTKVDQTDNVNCIQLNTLFANALAAFKVHELSEALAKFKAIHKLYPDDGPTRFYIHYLQKQLSSKSKKGSKEHATFIDVGNITSRLH